MTSSGDTREHASGTGALPRVQLLPDGGRPGAGRPVPPEPGVPVLGVLAVLLLVVLGLAAGVGVGAAGVTVGPLVVLALPLLAAGAVLCLRHPLYAVAAVPLLVFVGLRPVPGGAQVVQVLALAALGSALFGARPAPAPARALPAPLLWALGLVLVALAATVTSAYVVTSLRTDLNLLLGVALACICTSRCRTGRDLAVLLRCFAVGALLVAVPALAQVGSLQGYYGGTIVEGRLTGSFVQPNELGSYSVTAFWVCCALAVASRHRADRLLGGAAAAASLAAMLFSLSRGSWTGLLVGAVGLVVLHPPAWRPAVKVAGAVVLLLALVLVASPFSQADVISQRLSTVVNGAANPDDRRDLVRQQALTLLAEAPALGNGPGSFFLEAADADSVVASYRRLHAHNIVLQVGAELGLAGIAVLLALTASVARRVLRSTAALRRARRPREAAVVALLASACISLAAHGLVDVTFQNPVIMIVHWLLLGVLMAALRLAGALCPTTAPAAGRPDPAARQAVAPA